jgi:hypothetical protein
MNELEIIYLPVENWIKIIFIICTILILIARVSLGIRFQYFLAFWNIHRYFYFVSGQRISSPTNISFIFLRVLTTAFLVNYFFDTKNYFHENDFENYMIWNVIILLGIFLKFVLEKVLAHLFKYQKKLKEVTNYRIGIKNLFSIHLFFFLFLFTFSNFSFETAFTVSVILICCYQLLFYRFIFNKIPINSPKGLVYFILYLCTFEIAPIVGIISFLK